MEGRTPDRPVRERVAELPTQPRILVALGRLTPSGTALAVGVGLLTGALLAYVVARETSIFALRTVTVEGASPAVSAQVRAALEPIEGSSLVTLDGDAVIRRVESLPTVVSARYDRAFPHGLELTVLPERPVAVVRQGRDSWLVSARARVMRRLEPGAERVYPRIWLDRSVAVDLGGLLEPHAVRSTTAALAVLASSELAGRVTTAKMENGRLTLALRSGVELLLGRPTLLALKLAVAGRVLEPVRDHDRGGYLDVSVPERPVGRFNSQLAS